MTEILQSHIVINTNNCTQKASLILSEHTALPQSVIKDAMQKGAVWLIRGKSKKRLRRVSKALNEGDVLEINYNPGILNQKVPHPELIHDAGDYSIWFKPFGMTCQGSRWGDFASIHRWVELHMPEITNTAQRPVFLVHRLDKATTGLILLAHSKTAAQLFSQMFAEGRIDKRYQAIVHGDFFNMIGAEGFCTVEQPINGKNSVSVFSLVEYRDGKSLLDVQLKTGRKHQIRRHLSSLGYPIVGDRLYGNEENPDRDLQLQSVSLEFICPFSLSDRNFSLIQTHCKEKLLVL